MVLMQASAAESAAARTFHSGLPELVGHKESALLAGERNVAMLAEALALVAQRPDLRRPMGSEGRRKIEPQGITQIRAAQVVLLYRQALPSDPST